MKRLVAGLLGILLVVTGCARVTDGSPVVGARDVDPAVFFAGDVPTYGQTLSTEQTATQAYLRALRRTDPCGFTPQRALSRVGEVISAGTMFEFNACELEIKVAGEADSKIVTVAAAMADVGADAPAFTVGDRPVYRFSDEYCGLQVPLPLDALPGAPALTTADQPYLQIAELLPQSCDFTEELTKAVVAAIDPARFPLRDALAVYQLRAAEFDPCAVLGSVSDVVSWKSGVDLPYVCAFTLRRNDVDVNVRLAMRAISTQGSEGFVREERDGIEFYVDNEYCAVIAFLGDELKRTTVGGSAIDMGDWATAPAVTVTVDDPPCDSATDVAVAVAKAVG